MTAPHFRIIDRFYDRIRLANEGVITNCWFWKGGLDTNGYGCFKIPSKQVIAHRFSYELFKGRIPKGLVIDHICRNKSCVNPDHLDAVTQKENISRAIRTR